MYAPNGHNVIPMNMTQNVYQQNYQNQYHRDYQAEEEPKSIEDVQGKSNSSNEIWRTKFYKVVYLKQFTAKHRILTPDFKSKEPSGSVDISDKKYQDWILYSKLPPHIRRLF